MITTGGMMAGAIGGVVGPGALTYVVLPVSVLRPCLIVTIIETL